MRASLCLCAVVFLAVVPASAQEQSFNVGVKAGMLFPGEVYISALDLDVDTNAGFAGHITADAMVAPKLSIGAFVFLGTTTEDFTGEGATVTTFGGTLKGRFHTGSGLQIRPGAALGYQSITGDIFEDVSGFDAGAILEFAYPISETAFFTAEFSFISQPAGGNGDTDVTFTPRPFIAVGVEFGK